MFYTSQDFDLVRIKTNEGAPSLRGFRKGGNPDRVHRDPRTIRKANRSKNLGRTLADFRSELSYLLKFVIPNGRRARRNLLFSLEP